MKWDREHRSDRVEDRRGQRSGGGRGVDPNVAMGLFRVATRFGWPGVVVFVLGAAGYLFLAQPQQLADVEVGGAPSDEPAAFVGFVLDDVQATWAGLLGARYRPTTLVLFADRTPTACGTGAAAAGPFYCPGDEKVYIDLSFYGELARRFGAPGDFAQAYVIAHEVGHHVQHVLGLDQGARDAGAAGGSVRLELQADCFAGMWAGSTARRGLLEAGDLDEAITAAAAIGDDAIQRDAGGAVRPDSFTHGTAAQRQRWLHRGFEATDLAACDTTAVREL